MAVYTSVADLRGALAPAGDASAATAASLPDAELTDAIDEAGQEVDARLSDRYTVPFGEPFPPLVVQITRDLAAWRATLTHRRSNPVDPNDPVRLRYMDALALLKQIGKGEVDLDVAGTGAGEPTVINPLSTDLFSLADVGLVERP